MKAPTSRPKSQIIGLFPALQGAGGVQEAGRLTAIALSEIAASRGWEVDFLSLNDSRGRGSFSWNGREVHFHGFDRAKPRLVSTAVARSSNRACVILALHPNLALAAGPVKLLKPRTKLGIISHGVDVWQRLPLARRRAFLSAEILLAPSQYTLDRIVDVQGVDEVRTRLLPWCLNPAFFELAAKPGDLPVPANFPQGFVVMTAARLSKEEGYKGVDHLIRAVAQIASEVPSLHLVVVGSGDDQGRHVELARELGISNCVRFFQDLSREQMAGCYSRCDLFALPSTGEGFGFVFLEAMAFGKPVVGAAAGGVTDIVEHRQNGLLVAPNNFEQLVEALEQLLGSEPLRSELGRKGAAVVRSKFQFSNFRSRMEDILNELGRS